MSDAALRARSARQYVSRGHLVRRRTIERYLAGTDSPRLHIGAGEHRLDGWLNSDLVAGEVYLDLARALPFPDATFDYVFGEHVIEHLSESAALRLMVELRRVLRPGGVARITTPDLRKLIALYDGSSGFDWREYASWLPDRDAYTQPAQLFNDQMRLWGHRYVYDEPDLRERLHAAGFTNVERFEPNESDRPELRAIERHGGGGWGNAADAMSLQAS